MAMRLTVSTSATVGVSVPSNGTQAPLYAPSHNAFIQLTTVTPSSNKCVRNHDTPVLPVNKKRFAPPSPSKMPLIPNPFEHHRESSIYIDRLSQLSRKPDRV